MPVFEQLRRDMVASKLYVSWRPNVQTQQGQRRSRWKGEGGEHADVRPYRPGDRVTQINQKMRAKDPSRLYVNLFESEQKVIFTLVVDVGPTMKTGTQRLNKVELATVLAGSILNSAKCTGDLGRMISFDNRRVYRTLRPMCAGKLSHWAVPALLSPDVEHSTAGGGFSAASGSIGLQKSLVCIISDFRLWGQKDWEALAKVSRRHQVVCFVVHDLREAQLPDEPLLPGLPFLPGIFDVQGPDGKNRLVFATQANRAAVASSFAERQQNLQLRFAESGCKWCTFCTGESSDELRAHQLSVFRSQRPGGCLDADYRSGGSP